MALKPRVEQVRLDVCEDYTAAPIWAVQGAVNSLLLDITVLQSGEAIDFTDTEVTFIYRDAVGSIDRAVATHDVGFPVQLTGITGNLTCVLPAIATERAGDVECEVMVVDEAANITVKTPTFKVHVLESIQD